MKLTQVSIQNGIGETLHLPLHSYVNGFLVKDITGLDPVGASLVSTTVARLDGAQFQASRRETRNIVLTLGLEPDYTIHEDVGSLRRTLYNYAMPEAEVRLIFDLNGVPFASTLARVESLETSLFSASPEVQISFVAYDPDFIGVEQLKSGSPLSTGTTIVYNGTVATGLHFIYTVDNLTDPWIEIVGPSGIPRRVQFKGVFSKTFEIDTRPGNKYVKEYGGVYGNVSLLYAVHRTAIWPLLEPGTNILTFATGGNTTLTYDANLRYGGL